ncbi:uncharacterized protein M437DRAFT_64356 [Aureobasidium melanogenum CBS 110374]|uniref:Uncharacterized protein n=1 Tax=Aureobasidium melanogenum (strain CBS 110374) TaxID=1043003 RepID=A0A074VZK6_AURM1|nr:uncharacterized protein M437DRAFT_64356 [Aureobasidium melanogenum CBS 110374]KEQ64729.1 hypothetical protein M437DRAFT_64356 [Aureobasidium melanogenum CBS 110374]
MSDDSGQRVLEYASRQGSYLANHFLIFVQKVGIAHLHVLMKTLRGDQQQQQQRAEDRQQRRRVEAGASSLPNTKEGSYTHGTLILLTPTRQLSTNLRLIACLLRLSRRGQRFPSRPPLHFPARVDLLTDIGVAESE